MYHVGKHTHRHRRGFKIAIAIVISLIVVSAGYWLVNLQLPSSPHIQNAPPTNSYYDVSRSPEVTVSKPEFTMKLPSGWTERNTQKSSTGPKYTFASRSEQARQLDVYIDNPPTGMALNRAVAVSAQGSGLNYDSVSDNCATYTDPKNQNPETGLAPARWQEVDFVCDMAGAARAVVGTISRDGMNQVEVTGAAGNTKRIFITYTDNAISPNYTTLYDILGSLQFK